MIPPEQLDGFYRQTGFKRLSPVWAKLEIVLGLLAVACGLRLISHPDELMAAAGVTLFVLGGYLALAGHRSHLYQSNNLLAAYLGGRIESHASQPHGNLS